MKLIRFLIVMLVMFVSFGLAYADGPIDPPPGQFYFSCGHR